MTASVSSADGGQVAQALAVVSHQERLFVDWERFWQGTWNVNPEEHRLYLGTQKAVYDDCCKRQICDISLAPWPELSLVGPYLKACRRGSVGSADGGRLDEAVRVDHPYLLDRRPPLFFSSITTGDDLVYVDLARAYWSIYTRATLDVSYDGESPPKPGNVHFLDAEAFGAYKLARNGLMGMMRRQRRRLLDHGDYGLEVVPSHRRYPDLWGLVMDCMDVIAWSARDLGAVYYHTDGAIFKRADDADAWIELLAANFGLTATIRAAGAGYVLGLSRFKIGDASTGRFGRGEHVDSMIRPLPMQQSYLTEWLAGTSILVNTSETTRSIT